MKYIIMSMVLVLTLFVSACTTEPATTHMGGEPIQVSSTDELVSLIESSQRSYGGFYGGGIARSLDVVQEAVAFDGAATGTPTSSKSDFSQTNVQEEGVDEADIIKTNGEYIYTVSDSTLFIIHKEGEIVFEQSLDYSPQGLFILDDVLFVIGQSYGEIELYNTITTSLPYSNTYIEQFDVSKPSQANVITSTVTEGNFFQARMVNDVVYVLTQTYPEISRPYPVFVTDGVARELPMTSMYYFPGQYDSTQTVSIHAFSGDEHEVTAYVVDYLQHVYMSDDSLYLTSTDYINEYEITLSFVEKEIQSYLSADDRDKINRINDVDSDILSQVEKEQKKVQIYYQAIESLDKEQQKEFEELVESLVSEELSSYEAMEFTQLMKFSYDGLSVEFVEEGLVPGYLDSQFSIDEFEGITRIATTINARYDMSKEEWTESINKVYTLDENLEIMDSISLAEDERIYSVRFTDELVYIVTFKQIDPFFVINVSNPNNIVNLGELKIPGFSEYLHPYKDNFVIGVGMDVDEKTQRRNGIKLSLFDVSDVTNPLEVSSFVAQEQSNTPVNYDHKAFLINPQREIVVLPVSINDWREQENNFAGAYVFDLANDEINLKGTVRHSKGSQDVWSSQVQRSLYIDDVLYTKSLYLLKMSDLETLEEIKDVELETSYSNNYVDEYEELPPPVDIIR